MSLIEQALKRWRQESGSLPHGLAGAAEWSDPHDPEAPSETAAPAGPFPPEEAPSSSQAPGREAAFPVEPRETSYPVEQRKPAAEPATPPRIEQRESAAERPAPFPIELREPAAERAPAYPIEVQEPAAERASRIETSAEPSGTQSAESWKPLGSITAFSGFNGSVAGKLVSGPKMDPESVEQYGRLAAALHHAQQERGIKKAMVTSALAGEGKTLTALNLALTLSESYRRRVAFIDADLRRSSVHSLLNVANVAGLSETLKDASQMKATLLQISPRLSVLLAGRSGRDPMGALTSQRMAQVLDEAAASFDWVIVDTPPVVLLPDTNLLARMVDVAIIVVQAGQTAYDLVERAVEAVDRERVLGVVLNDVKDREALEYYYSPRVSP